MFRLDKLSFKIGFARLLYLKKHPTTFWGWNRFIFITPGKKIYNMNNINFLSRYEMFLSVSYPLDN